MESTGQQKESLLNNGEEGANTRSQVKSQGSLQGDTPDAKGQHEEQPCRTLLKQVLLVAAGLFGGQSIVHIMDMVHHQEAPNAADPIAFGGYALATYLGAWLLEAKTSCSGLLAEQAIPVMRIIAFFGFIYALISVGIDDWNDISSDPDIPTNTTNSSFGL